MAEGQDKDHLNEFFKSLSLQDEEGRLQKEYTDYVSLMLLNQFSKFLENKLEKPVVLEPCGSSAENLKCYFPDDIGDVDIVIFPGLEDLAVSEEMIEYLTENPLHVRINGAGHPTLQSCLVEGTDYVATSAVKSFHPAIYGTHVLKYFVIVCDLSSRWQSEVKLKAKVSSRLKKDSRGPAVTFDFANSFPPMSEQLQALREPDSVRFDPSAWEWLAVSMCEMRGVEYSKRHADVLNDYLQFCNESLQSLREHPRGILQGFSEFTQEIWQSERAKTLKAQVQQIENESTGRHDLCVTQQNSEYCDENAGAPRSPSRAEAQQFSVNDCAKNLESEKCSSILSVVSNGLQRAIYGDRGNNEYETNLYENETINRKWESRQSLSRGQHPKDVQRSEDVDGLKFAGESGSEKLTEQTEEPSWDDQTTTAVLKDNVQIKGTRVDHSQSCQGFRFHNKPEEAVVNHCLGQEKDFYDFQLVEDKDDNSYSEEIKAHDRIGGVDFVPALKARGWPKVAREWIERSRRWPSRETIERITREGFHLVVKTPKIGGNPDCDFRLSFTHAEYILSHELNDIQRDCYRCLKIYYRAYLRTKPKSLVTYHLKNILFYVCEETGLELWTEDNRARCMMLLLRRLHEALKTKRLPHYFVKASNLFDESCIGDPEALVYLAVKVDEIMENPMKLPTVEETKKKESERPLVLDSLAEPAATGSTLIEQDVAFKGIDAEVSSIVLKDTVPNNLSTTEEPLVHNSFSEPSATTGTNISTQDVAFKGDNVQDRRAVLKQAVPSNSATTEGPLDIDSTLTGRDIPENGAQLPSLVSEPFGATGTSIKTQDVASKGEDAKDYSVVLKEVLSDSSTTETTSLKGGRFHDLKELYICTCSEVITLAMSGDEVKEDLDSLEKSLVREVKDLASRYSIDAAGLLAMFDCGWNIVYFKVLLNNDPNMRRRMMDAMQGLLEMFKHVLNQEDFGPGNEEALAERLLDPTSFNLSHVLPRGCRMDLTWQILNSLEPRPTNVNEVHTEDIPLD